MGNLDPEDDEPEIQPVPAYADVAPFGSGMAETGGGRDDESDGDAKVRVAHASPDAPAVDVYVDESPEDAEPTVAGVEFTDITGYLELPAGEYDVTITAADSDEAVPPTPVTLDLGDDDYTVAAVGETRPRERNPNSP